MVKLFDTNTIFISRVRSHLNKFLLCVVIKCSDVLEERNAFNFMVTELLQVYATVIQRKKLCHLYSTVWDSLASHSYGRWKEGLGLSRTNGSYDFQEQSSFSSASPVGDVKITQTFSTTQCRNGSAICLENTKWLFAALHRIPEYQCWHLQSIMENVNFSTSFWK